jgi:predicted dienelactone hydrolase
VKAGDPTRFQDWQSRPADVSFVLDSLDELETQVPALAGRIDAAIGVSGHSLAHGPTHRASFSCSRRWAGLPTRGSP